MPPLVSVVIPVYNAVETIIPCVKSVLNQTYENLEIIVVDDGSTDATRMILEEYKKEFCINKLRIIYQDNSGPSAARNLGVKLSKGEYIAFLDSDDQWKETKIEKQINSFRESNAVLVGCKCQIGEDKGIKSIETKNLIDISFHQLLYHNCFSTPSVICKSNILKEIKFNSTQRYSEDYRLWLMIALKYKCAMLDECLVKLCDKPLFGSSGLSAKLWEMEKGELSNFMFMYKKSHISFFLFLISSSFSVLKFSRRLLLSKLK